MKLLMKWVNIQIKNLTLEHELEKQRAMTRVEALEALMNTKK
jgi:hypothetical protein